MLHLTLLSPENLTQFEAWRLWYQSVDISNSVLLLGITTRNWGRIGKGLEAIAAFAVLLDIIGATAVREFGTKLSALATLRKAKGMTVSGLQLMGDFFVLFIPPFFFRLQPIKRYLIVIWHLVRGAGRTLTIRDARGPDLRRILHCCLKVRSTHSGKRRKDRWRQTRFAAAARFHDFNNRLVWPFILTISVLGAVIVFYVSFSRDEIIKSSIEGIIKGFFTLSLIATVLGLALVIIQFIVSILFLVSALVTSLIDVLLIEPIAKIIEHPRNENLIKGVSLGVFLVGFYFDLLAS